MAKPLFVLSLLLLLLLVPIYSSNPTANAAPPQPLTVHYELTKYGFPTGLLPTNVLAYNLNRTSGDFAIHLRETCKVTLQPDNYVATYSKRITGKIVAGRIAEVDGIRVRAFFKWWSITGIKSNGGDLVFEFGVVTAKKYPSKNFDRSPRCEGQRSAS